MTLHRSPLRVGRIPYANLVPIFHGLATGSVPGGVSFVDGHPSELNRMLRDGELDLSPSSSIEYAVRPDRYLPCPGISISSRRRVMSVLLLSNGPLRRLPPDPIAVTGTSDTSITLLEILLRESLGRANLLVRTELSPREALRRYPAHLVIGDEAIRASLAGVAPHVTDLGAWWVPVSPSKGTVVLVHGQNRSRVEMVRKLPFLQEAGCMPFSPAANGSGHMSPGRGRMACRKNDLINIFKKLIQSQHPGLTRLYHPVDLRQLC